MMKILFGKSLVVSMILVLFIGGFSTSVSAAESGVSQEKNITEKVTVENSSVLSDSLIESADKYIKVVDKEFKISDQKKLKSEVGNEQFQGIKTQVKKANEQLAELNKDTLSVDGKAISTNFNLDVKDDTIFYTAAAKEGKNDFKAYWWGCKIWLNKTTVKKVMNVGTSGGGAAIGAALGNVPGAVAGAIVGSVLSEFVNPSAARAVVIRVNWPTYVTGISFQ